MNMKSQSWGVVIVSREMDGKATTYVCKEEAGVSIDANVQHAEPIFLISPSVIDVNCGDRAVISNIEWDS